MDFVIELTLRSVGVDFVKRCYVRVLCDCCLQLSVPVVRVFVCRCGCVPSRPPCTLAYVRVCPCALVTQCACGVCDSLCASVQVWVLGVFRFSLHSSWADVRVHTHVSECMRLGGWCRSCVGVHVGVC